MLKLLFFFLITLLLSPNAYACTVCFGNPDSPLSKGLVMGVYTLIAIVGSVLLAIAYFIFHLWKKGKLINE